MSKQDHDKKMTFNIEEFKDLQNVDGFKTVVKNINSARDEEQAENHFYSLQVALKLQNLKGLKLIAFEKGKPPKDIIFEYGGIKYAIEVKTMRLFNRAKEVNKPPYRMNPDDYFDSTGNLKCKLPKKLPKFESKYDYKEIIDIINEAYNQLDKGSVNIIILISKVGWIDKADIEDVWNILFVKRLQQYPLLMAIVFCDITTQNYVFQNPQLPYMDKELKSHIEMCKFEGIG